MKVVSVRAIDGPNVYIRKPVLVMRLDLEEYTERESYEFSGFVERLLEWCPGLYDHYCAMGRPGGFIERLYGGTYLGHIVEHVALELLTVVGYKANFGKTRGAGRPGLYTVVIEYESELPARLLLQTAVELVDAAARGKSFPLDRRLDEVRSVMATVDLGPSTAALVAAARARGVPAQRIGTGSLLQLGTGRYRKFLQATMTQATSAVAVDIAGDKGIAKIVLATAGIPVPKGQVAQTLGDAKRAFFELRRPIVVKPVNGCQGQAVTLGVRDEESLEAAFDLAKGLSPTVLIEEFASGRQFRLLVVAGRMVAAAERIPAHVVGDGVHSVEELVQFVNRSPERGEDHEKPLTRIAVDEVALRYLRQTGRSLHTVPAAGEFVFLRDSANLSTGGIAIDVTSEVHPAMARLAVRAAMAAGLNICGVDVVALDIRSNVDEAQAVVIEINAAPGIRMHHYPSIGIQRDVAGPIVESMYPDGEKSRIPVVSVTGTNGKTTTTRMIAHVLRESGYAVGMTTTEGVYIGDECVLAGDTTGPQSARLVLADPTIDVAVLETARGGIMRGGLGYESADVGIITNIALDHIGQDGLQSIEDLARVKSLVAECLVEQSGLAVLNADDPQVVKIGHHLKSEIAYVSMVDDNPTLKRHLARGGKAYFLRDGWIVEAAGSLEWRLTPVVDLPITLGGLAEFHVANALMALAATRHLGVSRHQAVEVLREFRSDTHNPGRVNLFRLPSGQVVICDYGHNPDGVRALGELSRRLSDQMAPAVIGFPGDRDDSVIRTAAQVAATYFGPLYVKEDHDTRGRRRGEMAALIAEAAQAVRPYAHISVQYDECAALADMLDSHAQEPYLFMFHEHLEPVRNFLVAQGAVEQGALQPELNPSVISAM